MCCIECIFTHGEEELVIVKQCPIKNDSFILQIMNSLTLSKWGAQTVSQYSRKSKYGKKMWEKVRFSMVKNSIINVHVWSRSLKNIKKVRLTTGSYSTIS